jgi:hypothetical protein
VHHGGLFGDEIDEVRDSKGGEQGEDSPVNDNDGVHECEGDTMCQDEGGRDKR